MKRKDAYVLIISTFIVIIVWVVISILGSAFNSTISPSIARQIVAIRPTFDIQIIAGLKKREIVIPATTIPTIETTPSASNAAQTILPSPTPVSQSTQPTSTNSAEATTLP